ncbi:MAG TPA: hypothetical protein VJM83_06625 [Nitrospirota bacterium]|nr:hypothetical protein [Nitrospirota bacterium]
MDIFQTFFMRHGGMAGIFILMLGVMFFAFVKRSIGVMIGLVGLAFMMFYYVL